MCQALVLMSPQLFTACLEALFSAEQVGGMQMGRMPAEDDALLAQRLQEEFNSSNGARPKRSAASQAKKRLAEVHIAAARVW